VVARANLLSVGSGIVPLERRLGELIRRGTGDLLPELLGSFHIGTLVDVYAEPNVARVDTCGGEEAEEEADQSRVAVNEDDPFKV